MMPQKLTDNTQSRSMLNSDVEEVMMYPDDAGLCRLSQALLMPSCQQLVANFAKKLNQSHRRNANVAKILELRARVAQHC
mmetsp:Transcript_8389/g.14206  ORF Transcript_8389/g.14206 Transcript_8389/m.14206 type:complete len:80 (+) Transcript_8389:231-470(+)